MTTLVDYRVCCVCVKQPLNTCPLGCNRRESEGVNGWQKGSSKATPPGTKKHLDMSPHPGSQVGVTSWAQGSQLGVFFPPGSWAYIKGMRCWLQDCFLTEIPGTRGDALWNALSTLQSLGTGFLWGQIRKQKWWPRSTVSHWRQYLPDPKRLLLPWGPPFPLEHCPNSPLRRR